MNLYQLIYQSQSLVPFGTPELTALLNQCRAYNQAHGISGILLYTPGGKFLQVLEGTQAAVQNLYQHRIVADPRHTNCRVFGEGPCQRRTFADWTMAFRAAPDLDLRTLLDYVSLGNDNLALLMLRPPIRLELLELLLDFMADGETDLFAAPSR